MDTIKQLQADRRILAECRETGEVFSLADAVMFYVGDPLPEDAQRWVDEFKSGLAAREKALRENRRKAREASEKGATAVGLGKILEHLVPVVEGFGMDSRDVRAMFQPIDYVAFNGLSARDGEVDSMVFLDVKTGKAGLSPSQRQIRDVIEGGKVEVARYGRSS